jgi:hypothetical protein
MSPLFFRVSGVFDYDTIIHYLAENVNKKKSLIVNDL